MSALYFGGITSAYSYFEPVYKEVSKNFIPIAETVCAVALGALSAYTDFHLFLPFFFVGVAIGIYNHGKNKQEHNSCHTNPVSCANGLLEQVTGVRLPAIILLLFSTATTLDHIKHHRKIYVPITATYMGAWSVSFLCKNVVSYFSKVQ